MNEQDDLEATGVDKPFPYEVGELLVAHNSSFYTMEIFKYLYEPISPNEPSPQYPTANGKPFMYLGTEVLRFNGLDGREHYQIKVYKFLFEEKIIYRKCGSTTSFIFPLEGKQNEAL